MAHVGFKAKGRAGRIGTGTMLKSLYAAAWKEVFADPAAAVLKYEPTWQLSLPVAHRKAGHPR